MIKTLLSPLAWFGRSAIGRLILFRKDLATLWLAFRHPATPAYLKLAMVAVLAYLVSPIDIFPDVLPLIGIVDDVMLVGLAMNWILGRLPVEVRAKPAGSYSTRRG